MLKQPSHWFAALCVVLAASPALAQEGDAPPTQAPPPAQAPKSGQVAIPEGEDAPPAEAPKVDSVGAMAAPTATELDEGAVSEQRKTLVWIGFHNAKTYSRLFIKTNARAALEVLPGPGQVVFRIKKSRSRLRNNLRYIDTSYFPTALYRVTPRKADDDVDVVVQMRDVVAYKVKRKAETVYVDFELPAKK